VTSQRADRSQDESIARSGIPGLSLDGSFDVLIEGKAEIEGDQTCLNDGHVLARLTISAAGLTWDMSSSVPTLRKSLSGIESGLEQIPDPHFPQNMRVMVLPESAE
jgi:hypothetical protein